MRIVFHPAFLPCFQPFHFSPTHRRAYATKDDPLQANRVHVDCHVINFLFTNKALPSNHYFRLNFSRCFFFLLLILSISALLPCLSLFTCAFFSPVSTLTTITIKLSSLLNFHSLVVRLLKQLPSSSKILKAFLLFSP